MIPPTPSISTRSEPTAAWRENSTIASNSSARPSRAEAMSGESGAAKRQGEMASISLIGRPSAASSTPGSLIAALAGSKPLATGLKALTV